MKLAGKKALVTGAARGIGRGCALELARAGADVVVNDLTASREAEEVVAEVRALGRDAALVEGDVFERPSCESVVSRALGAFGHTSPHDRLGRRGEPALAAVAGEVVHADAAAEPGELGDLVFGTRGVDERVAHGQLPCRRELDRGHVEMISATTDIAPGQ